jgi:hypothetical protein
MNICATCGEWIPAGVAHPCTGVRLPKLVRQVAVGPVTDTGHRLEVRLTITFQNAATAPETMLMHTTYKKHLVESYQTIENYIPQAAPHNTICRVSLRDFMTSFGRYAQHLADQIRTHGTAIRPDSIVFADALLGLFFTSDVPIAGMDIHCFPCLPQGQLSTVTFDLNSQEFGDMVKLLRFQYHAGDRLYRNNDNGQKSAALSDLTSKSGDAKNAWNRQRNSAWFQNMFTELERIALQMKFQTQPPAFQQNKNHLGQMLNRQRF